MNIFLVLSTIFVATIAYPQQEILNSQWITFKITHEKEYESENEETYRMNVFTENLKKINEHNTQYEEGLVTYTMGINRFADMTSDEFMDYVKKSGVQNINSRPQGNSVYQMPNKSIELVSVDWRKNGAVTQVKNQGSCGSCYTFSSTGAIEGQYFLKTGRLISLSEQNLVDCSSIFGNQGCNGGWMDTCFEYVKQYGIERENDYPYHDSVGSCQFSKAKSVLNVRDYVDIPQGNEQALQNALQSQGPIAVAIHATSNMQFYKNGVFYDPLCRTNALNHAVLAVGQGDDAGQQYYIVKNSWSAQWGEQGYIRMSRNRQNNCGIASAASYPLL